MLVATMQRKIGPKYYSILLVSHALLNILYIFIFLSLFCPLTKTPYSYKASPITHLNLHPTIHQHSLSFYHADFIITAYPGN